MRKALGCAVLAVFLVAGCGSGGDGSDAQETSITAAASHADQKGLSITVPGTLAAGVAELQASTRGHLGLAIMPVGGDQVVSFGDWTTGPAWSTMKVPLTIAALRLSGGSPSYAASAAITASDNAAADTLWQSLGTNQEAAQAVQSVLREGGDAKTTVPATRSRPENSAFGQADWSLADQVRFASRLPCLPQSAPVINLMEQIQAAQRWGLGAFNGAEFKGGWGPDASGAYLVRQFGLISTPSGQLAVAFAAQPDSGAFSDGMTMLDKLSTVISQHLNELAGGRCAA
ncbi:class A beta-lactamase-related serine hydrolase [Nocardia colli]|uniref:class A beta-lactamase-related serine hydrolase n=1 Tax=Nocardia colli TaxID=2545717 RepID=UPI001CC58899|nr:class A beta-lactamase-related serine hydrolase [Nocardia colli]